MSIDMFSIINHPDCPKELKDSFERSIHDLTSTRVIIVYKDAILGSGNCILVSGEGENLSFGVSNILTYQSISRIRIIPNGNDHAIIVYELSDTGEEIRSEIYMPGDLIIFREGV